MEVTIGDNLGMIPEGQYEGYLWYSDQKTPKRVNGKIDLSDLSINPFIVEGLLYDQDKETSVHIQHVGKYMVSVFHLLDVPESNLIEKEYLPHRLPGVEKVRFKQIWEAESDPLCADMQVQQLKAIVFSGFKLKKA